MRNLDLKLEKAFQALQCGDYPRVPIYNAISEWYDKQVNSWKDACLRIDKKDRIRLAYILAVWHWRTSDKDNPYPEYTDEIRYDPMSSDSYMAGIWDHQLNKDQSICCLVFKMIPTAVRLAVHGGVYLNNKFTAELLDELRIIVFKHDLVGLCHPPMLNIQMLTASGFADRVFELAELAEGHQWGGITVTEEQKKAYIKAGLIKLNMNL